MAVKIRMKKLGRKHRPFFRICATDARSPRDGRVIEELGTYDPSIPETDARCQLNGERVEYWLGVGAQPSEKVRVLIKKYGRNGTHLEAQAAALERLAAPREIGDLGEPAYRPEPPAAEKTAAEQPAAEEPAAEPPAAAAGEGEVAQPSEPVAAEVAPSGEAPSGEAPSGEAPSGEAPSGEAPSGEAPSGEEGEAAVEPAAEPASGSAQEAAGEESKAESSG